VPSVLEGGDHPACIIGVHAVQQQLFCKVLESFGQAAWRGWRERHKRSKNPTKIVLSRFDAHGDETANSASVVLDGYEFSGLV
jgi:hypothetical protein